MHLFRNAQPTHRVWLLAALAVTCSPLVSRADDAAATTAPATAPASTNSPEAAAAPAAAATETTNTPATATSSEATNVPASTAAPAVTNTPPAATASAVTNAPATATAPAATNAPAAVIAPAAAATPAAANAAPPAAPAAAAAPKSATPAPAPEKVLYQPFNIGAEAGTTGFGGTAGWRFANHFGLVGGMDYMNATVNRTIESIPYSANVLLQSEYAALNLYPWKDRSFRFSFGAYFNQNQLKGKAVSDGTLEIEGAPVAAGESVNLVYKQQPINPYAAIGGNLYFDRARHFSLGAELGAFYLGNPKVHTTSTDPLVPQDALDSYSKKVSDNIKKVPVWPIIKISLNYSF